jgi:hypothetical protein
VTGGFVESDGELDDLSEIVLQDIICIKIAYKVNKYLISRLNVANLEFC